MEIVMGQMRKLFFLFGLMLTVFFITDLDSYAQETLDLDERKAGSRSEVLVESTFIGPIKIGMSRLDVEKLNILRIHPQFSGMTIPFNVYYQDDVVRKISVSLKYIQAPLRVGSVVIAEDLDIGTVVKEIGDCDGPLIMEGGKDWECREGQLRLSVGSTSVDEVWLSIGESRLF
jgi:hypothetical protein